MTIELLILATALVAHGVWVHLNMRQIRRDLLKIAGLNTRQARKSLLEDKVYVRLDKK